MTRRIILRLFSAVCLAILLHGSIFAAEALEFSHSFAITGEVQPINWRLKLEFSQPVSLLEISRRIKCKFNNSNANFKIINSLSLEAQEAAKPLPPERKVFIISPEGSINATGSFRITIGKELSSADGKSTLANDSLITFNSQKSISLTGSEPFFYSSTDKGILIDLSENIKDYRLKKHIRIFPTVGYFSVNRQYYSNRDCYKISGKFVTGKKYELKIAGGQVEGENQILDNARVEFIAKGPDPQISFAADRSVLELRSRQLVPLSFTSVGNFKCQLMRVPAFFGPALDSLTAFAESEEKRPLDSSSAKLGESAQRSIGQTAAKLDNLMLKFVKQHDNLKELAGKNNITDLKDFLAPEFSSDSQAFMGSDNPDSEYFFSLPLDYRPEPEKGGPVIVNVSESEVENGQTTARLFQVTDCSITYKFTRNELLLWITSIETGHPVADAAIMLIANDGRIIFPGRTSHDGILKINETQDYPNITFTDDKPEAGSGKITITSLIIAAVATQNDSSFIKLNTNRFFSSAVQQSSPDQQLQLSQRGHVFTERGVYRPGETVFWKATLREYKNSNIVAPGGQKVLVEITSPRSETIYSNELELNEFGTCSGAVEIKSFMPLGQYNLRLTSATATGTTNTSAVKPDAKWDFLMNRRSIADAQTNTNNSNNSQSEFDLPTLAATGFQVQEFEPPRHFVTIDMTSEKRKIRQIVGRDSEQLFLNCKIKGQYYTGGVVRHAKVAWTAHLTERISEANNFPLFHFGNNDVEKELIESGNSVLSKDGELIISLPVSKSVISGLNSIEISATVLDVDARPSTMVSRFSPEPAIRVGIAKLSNSLAQGQEFPLQTIVIDKNGNKISQGDIQLEIMRKRWFYTQKRDSEGGIFYNWASGWVRSYQTKQTIKDGSAIFDLILSEGGDYMLKATYNNGSDETVTAMSFFVDYSYASFEDFNKNSRIRSENEILLMPDRTVAAVNERVRIRYSMPRPCEYALFTRECDDILSARVVKLDHAQGEFIETMTEECRPNVYVGLLAPATRGGFPLYTSQVDSDYPRAYFGFANIKVQNTVDALSISIAPELNGELKAMPGDIQKLSFMAKDKNGKPAEAELAICVVDEAVLSLTGFNTPILTTLTDFLLPLCVFTGDLRTSLISQELFKLISTRALTGGDQGAGGIASDLESRKDFRPVAFWHPAILTNAEGRCEIEFKLPDSMTSYRIYVVATDRGTGFGSKERQLKVSREFYIEPGLPKFLTAGDEAVFPISLSNKGPQSGIATLKIAETTNITAVPEKTEIQLSPYTNGIIKTRLEADNGAGEAKLVLAGQFNGMSDAIERSMPINTASTIIRRQLSGHFAGNHLVRPDIPTYVASMSAIERGGAISAKLNVSTTPWARIAPSLSYLMRYPYGCVEQTSSGIIPLAAMRGLIRDGKLPGFSLSMTDKFLESGINKLLKMQRGSGGFSYWPSEYSDSWWGSQYAVLALSLAQKAGYPIDNDRLDAATEYISKSLFRQNNEYLFENGIMALAVVNLAMNKKLKAADFDVLKNKYSKAGVESEPLLLWAEALCGETSIEELAARMAQIKPAPGSVSHGWHFSTVRQNAFALLANLTIKAERKQADDIAGALLNSLKDKGYWNSTADTGLALFALSEYFAATAPSLAEEATVTLTTSVGSRPLDTGKNGITIELEPAELLATSGIKLETPGKTMLNWSLEYSYPDLASRSESVNKGFSVEKRIENLNGNKEIRVGDLLKVTVEFEDQFRKEGDYVTLSYFVLEDPVPAGFTAINSALKNDSLPPEAEKEDEEYYCDWNDGAYTFYPDHKELRNDRLLAFKNRMWSGRFKIVYYLRAICEGTFKMKPTQAALMYNPEISGMSLPQTIKVLPAE